MHLVPVILVVTALMIFLVILSIASLAKVRKTNANLRRIVEEKTATLEQTIEALKETEEMFTQLLEHSPIYVFFKDENIRAIRLSRNYEKMLNMPLDAVLGKSMDELFPSEMAKSMIEVDKAILKKGEQITIEEELNGRYYTTTKFPITFKNKRYLAGYTIDINESKQYQLKLKKSEEYLKTITKAIEQSPVSVIITDPEGHIQYVNKCFQDVTGYTLDEVITKNPCILKSGYHDEEFYKDMWSTLLAGKVWQGEVYNKKKNGKLYWANQIISPVIEGDRITNFVAVKEDITESKEMIKELLIAKDKAEEASRTKSSFLANMSHELRTPLIGILGYSQIMGDELTNAEHKKMAGAIQFSGNRLLETVNSILDLSRIEKNQYDLKFTMVNLNEIAANAIAQLKPMINQKGLAINYDIPRGLNINCDESAVTTIMNNLLSNAEKYTESGCIHVKIRSLEIDRKKFIEMKISDTGIGIAPDKMDLIYEEFRQVSEGLSRSYQGSGLGLTITRRLVEKLKGHIEVESEENKGTTFKVYLPAEPVFGAVEKGTVSPDPEAESVKIKKLKVLLLEDDKVTQDVIKIYLRKKYEVDVFENVKNAAEAANDKEYDIFLVDINLRYGETGFDFVKKLKTHNRAAGKKIIASTAYAMKGDKEKILSEGFTHYISKPFTKADLNELLETA